MSDDGNILTTGFVLAQDITIDELTFSWIDDKQVEHHHTMKHSPMSFYNGGDFYPLVQLAMIVKEQSERIDELERKLK